MRKPAVFVSSTCYDLKQVRTDLHVYLDNAGFEPVLSEYSTFPVDPGAATVANCRKVVENRADIFVLIIGCRYGSTDEHGKSVTNLEYITARAKGIPIYVFAMRSILEILPIWASNPKADFKSTVDSPSLFEFVSTIRNSGQTWVFPFDVAQDIVGVLRTQLAYLFADALDLRRQIAGSELLSGKYKHLSASELRLVIEQPRGWEYLLFSEALLREIKLCEDLKRDWSHNLAFGLRSIESGEFFDSITERMSQALGIFEHLETLLNTTLPKAWGAPGEAGNTEEILYVANRLGAIYRTALEWKIGFYRLNLDARLSKMRSLAASMLDNAIAEVEEYAIGLHNKLTEAFAAPFGTSVSVEATLRLTAPDLTEFNQELDRVRNINWN